MDLRLEQKSKSDTHLPRNKSHTFAGLILNAGKREHALRSGESITEGNGVQVRFGRRSMKLYNQILYWPRIVLQFPSRRDLIKPRRSHGWRGDSSFSVFNSEAADTVT